MKIKTLLITLGVFAVLLGAVAFEAERRLSGKRLGGDFTLRSSTGDVSLSDFRGKAVVLYFGYTSCPDVCPMSLSKLATLLQSLPEQQRSRVVPLFVSVDSRGDTPEKAQSYAQFFAKGSRGVTGSRAEIDRVVDLYGTSYVFEEMPKSALGYSVQHSTSFFLIDADGKFVEKIPTELPSEELKARILALL